MGQDKALVEMDGTAMARRVADVLKEAGATSVVAIGGDEDALRALGLAWRADRFPGEGPLGGLLTALEALEAHDPVAVLATDLARVDVATVHALLAAVAGHDAALAHGDRLEPLCGVWRPDRCLRTLSDAFEDGERAVHRAISGLDLVAVEVDAASVRNINTPDDLDR